MWEVRGKIGGIDVETLKVSKEVRREIMGLTLSE